MTAAPGAAVAIYCKPHHRHAQDVAAALARWLQGRGYRTVSPGGDASPVALAVVLGGDGTMLHVAARLAAAQTPVLAVHLGTLGFLTETALDDLYDSLETVLAGGGARHRRALLHCGLERHGRLVAEFEALNEAVVSKGALARLIQLELTVAGERVGIYRADGLLVATPTGSTAYSFSAGGPVLHPSLEALIVTPICPHSLGQRPLVVRDQAEVVITLQSGVEPTFLTVDGQQGQPLEAGDRIRCLRSLHALTLVTAGERSFYQNLRTKLHWG